MSAIINGETRLFPIIGDPIQYVKSPERLTAGLAARGHNGICFPALVPEGALGEVMRALSLTANVDGVLVTMPHKRKVVAHCATRSDRTQLLGAASVLRRNTDGSWHADMLDGLAFLDAQRHAGARPDGARVLLIGAGAAGSAIAVALLQAGVRELIIHDRDERRSQALLNMLAVLGAGRVVLGPPDPTDCGMVCNASPAGMSPGDEPPVAGSLLKPAMFVGDVIAGHGTTPFLQAARAAGCRTADGDQMVEAVQESMLDFLLHKAD